MKPAEEYILNQPEPFQSMLIYLQRVIQQEVSDANLLYKWRLPFFYVGTRPLCYLNHSKDYVDVVFWNGRKLTVHTEHLTLAGRKKMKSLRYKSLEEIDESILKDLVNEAYSIRDRRFYD